MSRLREYIGDVARQVMWVVEALEDSLGPLQQVGGRDRIYEISGEAKQGAVFLIGSSAAAIGLGWKQQNRVDTIYYWQAFDAERAPDYAIDLPAGDFTLMIPAILEMLKSQQEGERPL